MKMKQNFGYFALVFWLLFLSSVSAASAKPAKILMIITETSDSRRTADSTTIESLMTKHLLDAGYEVMTPDTLGTSARLTANDIAVVRKGDIPKAKKAAVSCQADFILINTVRSTVLLQTSGYGIKTNTAVTVNTYKLLDPSGKILDTDSKKYTGAGASPESAQHESYIKMASGISDLLTDKKLAGHSSHPSVKPHPPVAPAPASEAVIASESRDSDDYPEIIIYHPSESRGLTRGVSRGFTRGLYRGFTRGLTRDPETDIIGEVKDRTGIRSVEINDRPVQFDNSGRFSYKANISESENHFRVAVVNNLGKIAAKDVIIMKESPKLVSGLKPVLWGLTIGISKYANPELNLEYGDKDALSLAEVLKKQEKKLFSEVHIKTLVNEKVTRNNIIETMTRHLSKAAPNDVVFIFIAGHGIKHQRSGSYYFVTYDSDIKTLLSRGLRMSDFEEQVKILSKDVNKVVIAMDTCHSGAMKVGARALGGGENLAEALRAASGLYILAASKGGESSLEDSKYKIHEGDAGHGAFTYALLKGMSGEANYDGDNYISLNELFQYVAKQVPRLTDGQQHPYFRSEGTDMPFVVLND